MRLINDEIYFRRHLWLDVEGGWFGDRWWVVGGGVLLSLLLLLMSWSSFFGSYIVKPPLSGSDSGSVWGGCQGNSKKKKNKTTTQEANIETLIRDVRKGEHRCERCDATVSQVQGYTDTDDSARGTGATGDDADDTLRRRHRWRTPPRRWCTYPPPRRRNRAWPGFAAGDADAATTASWVCVGLKKKKKNY